MLDRGEKLVEWGIERRYVFPFQSLYIKSSSKTMTKETCPFSDVDLVAFDENYVCVRGLRLLARLLYENQIHLFSGSNPRLITTLFQ